MVFFQGMLEIEIIEGKDLPDLDSSSFRSKKDVSDPYVTVDTIVGGTCTQRIAKTAVIKNSLNPQWNEKYQLEISHEAESIMFTVRDKDLFIVEHMGEMSIQAEDLISEEPISGFFDVMDSCGNPAGSLNINMQYKSAESIQTSGYELDNRSQMTYDNRSHKHTKVHKGHWGYSHNNGPAMWKQMGYSLADGPRQSPIDINEIEKDDSLYSLTPIYKDLAVSNIKNNGHTWKVQINEDAVQKGYSSLTGGPLGNEFVLKQFHAHWGKTNETGSEHTVNGQQYSGELHMVHYNKEKYGSMEEAVKYPDGIAVIGRLIQIGEQEDPEMNKICSLLPFIQHKGQTIEFNDAIDPGKFIPRKGSYWTYEGSLTTPSCNECVTWLLYQEPLIVSEAQMASMRMLKTYHPCDSCPADELGGQLVENYRPTCPLNTRIVKEYSKTEMEDCK